MLQEFVQRVIELADEAVNGVHTAFPGIIVAFDTDTCLATIQPLIKYRKPDGKNINYPLLYGVPVVFPQGFGQSATIAFPVFAGDYCLCVASEQSLDLWMYGYETETDLRHDLSNAICIPGLFSKPNAVMKEACSDNAIILDVNGTQIKVTDGRIYFNGDVTLNGNIIT